MMNRSRIILAAGLVLLVGLLTTGCNFNTYDNNVIYCTGLGQAIMLDIDTSRRATADPKIKALLDQACLELSKAKYGADSK